MGVVEGVEGAEDAEKVDDGVGYDFERLGSGISIGVGVDGATGDPPSWTLTALTLSASGASSAGRDSASATRFAFPMTYLISVVYSEIHDNWYCCLIVWGSDFLWIDGTRL